MNCPLKKTPKQELIRDFMNFKQENCARLEDLVEGRNFCRTIVQSEKRQ